MKPSLFSEIYKLLGIKGIVLILVAILLVGGLGSIFLERLFFPYISTWPILRNLHFLESQAPIVIIKREEVRIQEGINNVDVINKVKGTLVSVLQYDRAAKEVLPIPSAVSGVIVTSDGILVIPAAALRPNLSTIAILPDGRVLDVQILATDSLTGLAFLKIEASNLPVLNQNVSSDLRAGETLLALRASENSANALAFSVVVSRRSVPEPSLQAVYEFNRLHTFLDTNFNFNAPFLGSAIVNKDASLFGIVTQIGKDIVVLRSEDLKLAVTTFLEDRSFNWPSLKARYMILAGAEAQFFKFPAKYGILIKSAETPLAPGDFIYALDGRDLTAEEGFQQVLLSKKPGDKVKLNLIRQGVEKELELTL